MLILTLLLRSEVASNSPVIGDNGQPIEDVASLIMEALPDPCRSELLSWVKGEEV
jgi:hypothetical protein